MFSTLIIKELRGILQSPKFAATLAVCSVLILLSVLTGIREYRANVKQYDVARQLADEEMGQSKSWHRLSNKAIRPPDPMQIFVSGVNYDIGRWSTISTTDNIKLEHSVYSDDPIFALFRYFDFAFIVQFVFSLLAILFTYDAISGERESGMLRLVFSNAVPKARYLLAKALGAIIGLTVPIALPVLLGLLLVQIFDIPMNQDGWLQLGALLGISLLYFVAFIMTGLFISSLTKWSNVSFMISLVIWVLFVLIIPRSGVIAAGKIMSIPSVSEIEGQSAAYAKDQWAKFLVELERSQRARNQDSQQLDSAARAEQMRTGMAITDSMHQQYQADISEYEFKLLDELRHKRSAQEKLGLSLARFSPSAAYQLAAQSLARTDIGIKTRNEDAMQAYRNELGQFIDKQKEAPFAGGIQIAAGPEGVKINFLKGGKLDLTSLPRFQPPRQTLSDLLSSVVVDSGILALVILLSFAGSFMAFLRYDVR